MRVRCSFCGAEYEAAVTLAGLGLVGRCERCGRSGLHPADDDEAAARVMPRPRERSDADP
jgi:hypothetical protein